MLGSQVFKVISAEKSLFVCGTARSQTSNYMKFIVGHNSLRNLLKITKPDYIINCIGVIPQKSTSKSRWGDVFKMFRVNSLFSIQLSNLCNRTGICLIQIKTDCVFNGKKGPYSENSKKNARDVYGLTKRLGEKNASNQINIRTSIIGKEINSNASLFSWFENTHKNEGINGYTNHLWNGITTNAFAKLCKGIILESDIKNLNTHLIPMDYVSKHELLLQFKKYLNRNDIELSSFETAFSVDRRLESIDQDRNSALWKIAGYNEVPKIEELVLEMIKENSQK